MSLRTFCLLLASTAALSSRTRADVLVVDASGPPGAYLDIQPAVNAAQLRDTLLVKTGTYSGFLVHFKALSIVADTNAQVTVQGEVRVQFLPAGEAVLLSGLTVTGLPSALYLNQCQGSVRVQECTLFGRDYLTPAMNNGFTGVRITQCSDVALAHCAVSGGRGGPGFEGISDHGLSGRGVHADDSVVSIWKSTVVGGNGAPGVNYSNFGAHGGTAFYGSPNCLLFASGTTFAGGNGADGCNISVCQYSYGGNGGNGVHIAGDAWLIDSPASGGFFGYGCCFSANTGGPGVPRSGTTFHDLSGSARDLTTSAVVRAGLSITLTLSGQPGDYVKVLVSKPTSSLLLTKWFGMLHTTEAPTVLEIGTVPASGVLQVPLEVGLLPAGLEARRRHYQALFFDSNGDRRLGSPTSVTVIDPAF